MKKSTITTSPEPNSNMVLATVFTFKELQGLWQFANAQYLLIKARHENTDNHIESMCLAFSANCIIDIMDKIAEMLEPS